MPRFHVQDDLSKSGTVILDQKESRHALRVLRLKPGELVELFDPWGNVRRGIVARSKEGLLSIAVDKNSIPAADKDGPAAVRVTLAASVIKPEAMEWLIEKASELGVSRIVPMLSERSVVRLSKERWQSKIARWRKIALESCKQCGRSAIPEIAELSSMEAVLATFAGHDTVLIPTLAVEGASVYNTLKGRIGVSRILVLVGPEGDFSPREVELALKAGALPVSLGPLVMRSETAAMALLSALSFYCREVFHAKT